MVGSMGASQACWPSEDSFVPSINLSGVRVSPFTPSSTLTLSGYAEISENQTVALSMYPSLHL